MALRGPRARTRDAVEFVLTTPGVDLDNLTGQAAKALIAGQRKMGREIAKVARRAILDDVKSRRRGGLRFSGMNTRLGASTKVTPSAQSTTVTVSAKPPGPWSIVEYGSRPHDIVPVRKKALYFAGLWSDSVYHPGTAGHAYWTGAESALDAAVTPVIIAVIDDLLEVAA